MGVVYLPLGRPNFLSAARFHGLNCFFSSGLNCDALRVESSRSLRTGAAASPACDEAHRLDPAVYVWRDNWERGRLRAGLDNPRRLAMVDTCGKAGVSDTRSFGQKRETVQDPGKFSGSTVAQANSGLGLAKVNVTPAPWPVSASQQQSVHTDSSLHKMR